MPVAPIASETFCRTFCICKGGLTLVVAQSIAIVACVTILMNMKVSSRIICNA